MRDPSPRTDRSAIDVKTSYSHAVLVRGFILFSSNFPGHARYNHTVFVVAVTDI